MPHVGWSSSGTSLASPFGGMPQRIGNLLENQQLGPLIRGFGLGAGPKYDRFESRLQNAQGPLADLIRSTGDFSRGVYGQSEQAGREVSARGSAAFETLQDQIQQSLAQLPQYQQAGQAGVDYASRYASEAFSPTRDQPLYQEASRRLVDTIRPGLAARGLEAGGTGQRAETDATRNLAFDFAQRQRQDQAQAIPQLEQAAQSGAGLAQAGIQPAQTGMSSVGDLANYLQQQWGIPLNAAGQLLQLFSAGQAPNLQLLSSTSPVALPHSKGTQIL